jgi:predicted nucleic acid-binding protein
VILLDTNVLVYAVDSTAQFHASCHRVVEDAMSGRLGAVVVPQVLMEFYAVVTSTRHVQSPLYAADAAAQVMDWQRAISIRYPTARCLEEWAVLVGQQQRVGLEVHDLFLAAQMRAHQIDAICTVNTGDVAGIPGISVYHPDQV